MCIILILINCEVVSYAIINAMTYHHSLLAIFHRRNGKQRALLTRTLAKV